ncbi:unnamed protein product [Macrosiphum euphorbiae]|uniref:RNase H type-1 domain-containing protein n=1 Tax=Macrosiphum euphorbiae TaxID=13131 RepID=A0AAV0VPM9_9HEMI|nr:unnamed protein product [Macrosiphum euphorbiae]
MFNFLKDFLLDRSFQLNNFKFNCSGVLKHEHAITPPWVMELHSNTDLSQHIKSETMDYTFRNLTLSLLEDYQDYIKFYTDGSKTEAGVGASPYIGIPGNETADTYAKRAITSPEASLVQICSLGDIKGVLQSLTLQQWQHRWTSSLTKLNVIKPSINPWPTLTTKRRHEVIVNRLRIGHTWLTHNFLMRHEDPTQCTTCGEIITVEHVLLHCRKYADTKTSLNIPDHLYEILGPDLKNFNNTLMFLQQTKLYNLI